MNADMSVNIAGVEFKTPIIAASGTFGFGREYAQFYDPSRLGGICAKGLTLEPRQGNPPPRIAETPSGMLNSVGFQNPGVEDFLRDELPFLQSLDTRVIVNITANTIADFCELAERVSVPGVDMVELNISCPNLREGGMAFGVCAKSAAEVTAAVRKHCAPPLVVKLSPNVTDITEIARAVAHAGADALSLINTLVGMRININTRRPVLAMNTGGLSGPAVFPVALRMVWQVRRAVALPIIGMGGVTTGADAAEMMLAGADAVAVGTTCIADPYAPVRIIDELAAYCEAHDIQAARELTGAVEPWEV